MSVILVAVTRIVMEDIIPVAMAVHIEEGIIGIQEQVTITADIKDNHEKSNLHPHHAYQRKRRLFNTYQTTY